MIAEKLFDIAIQDLNSVEVLYKSKHYNIALFQLQQSIEKLVKSFGIKNNIVKPEEIAKKINHLPHKVFTQLYKSQIEEQSQYSGTPILIPDMIPPHQRGKNELRDNVEKLKELQAKIDDADLVKIKNISIEDIEKFIKGAEELDKEPVFDDEKLFLEIKDDFVKTHQHFIQYFANDSNIQAMSLDFIENSDAIARNKVNQYKFNKTQQSKLRYISYIWLNLSLTTSPHEQATRYPSIINGETPIDLYNESNPVIKYIPEFVKLIRNTIIKYKEVYSDSKDI